MSRLIDRIVAYGCRPLPVGDVFDLSPGGATTPTPRPPDGEAMHATRPELEDVDDAKLLAATHEEHQRLRARQGEPDLNTTTVSDVPALVADEVGRYIHELPGGTDMADLVLAVVPRRVQPVIATA